MIIMSMKIHMQTREPGKCVPGVDEYDFIPGEGYSVIVRTPLHPYEAGFIVWKWGE